MRCRAAGFDTFGDPLPPGAVSRVGSVRWWFGSNPQQCPVVFTPDGKEVVSCAGGQAICFLDAVTGREVRRITPEPGGVTQNQNERISTFALAPDGKTLMTASLWDPVLRLWDVATGKELRQIPGAKSGTYALAFSSEGKMFAAAGCAKGEGGIRLWNATTWQEVRQIPEPHDGWIGTLGFLPGGKTLISGGGICRDIRWWDVGTGREIRRREIGNHFSRLVVSPDGKRLAAFLSPGKFYFFNAETGEEISRTILPPECTEGGCLCFSPDGQSLAGSSWGNPFKGYSRGQLLIFSAATGQVVRRWDQPGIYQMGFSPDGKVLAQAGEFVIQLRDALTGKPVVPEPGLRKYVSSVVFPGEGKTLFLGCFEGQIGFCDPLTGKTQAPFRNPPMGFANRPRGAYNMALSPDGRKAALAGLAGILHVWEPTTGRVLCRIDKPPVEEDQPTFSPDGRLVAVKHQDHAIRCWDTTTGHLRCSLPPSLGRSPHPHVFSPDGRLLATGPDGYVDGTGPTMVYTDHSIRLWDTATGQQRGELTWPGQSRADGLAFTIDGKSLVAALTGFWQGSGFKESSVCLWDLASKRRVREFSFPPGNVWSLILSPDGKTLAAGAKDTIVLWELVSGQERGRFPGHRREVLSLAFSPDGRLLASGGWDYTALVWDVTGRCPDGRWTFRDARPGELERLWADLAGKEAMAYRALWELVAVGRQSVPFLAQRLRPVQVDKDRLARWIADLDADDFEVREKAKRKLEGLGEAAEGALRKALERPLSPEANRRAEGIMQGLLGRPCSSEQLQAFAR